MAFTSSVKITGGGKLKAVLANAEKAKSARKKQIKVGFFPDKKYDDGTPVALVAAIQEFGLGGNPERPFFRQSIAQLEQDLGRKLAGLIDPLTMTVSASDAEEIGRYAVEVVRNHIESLRDPANAQKTIELKDGKNNPLIDSGRLRDSADYQAE